ncbi:hypothetical protein ACRALDRAFT_1065581 [Sodiomyces alcalophilus JCM 7366]|uniref:uncharacterized protein n=1 Tax=Sodiomyces alcalophilus JCM 7366 TaxID=591952 RepID=UPI0039B500FC
MSRNTSTMVPSRASRASPAPSWSDSDSEFDDLITPCPSDDGISETATAEDTAIDDHHHGPPSHSRFTGPPTPIHDRFRPCSTNPAVDVHRLWAVMLALQRRYQCYKSTRMRIAADSDVQEASELMPSRACIDYLNESIEFLPEEGWKMLEPYIVRGTGSRSKLGMQRSS